MMPTRDTSERDVSIGRMTVSRIHCRMGVRGVADTESRFAGKNRHPKLHSPSRKGPLGEVAEWPNAPVSKTGMPERASRVRISPSPLDETR